MSDQPYQVVIHITDKPLRFKTAEDFSAYYESQRKQGDWKKFDHLPLLRVVDWRGAGGELEVVFKDKLPKETVKNEKGGELIIIG